MARPIYSLANLIKQSMYLGYIRSQSEADLTDHADSRFPASAIKDDSLGTISKGTQKSGGWRAGFFSGRQADFVALLNTNVPGGNNNTIVVQGSNDAVTWDTLVTYEVVSASRCLYIPFPESYTYQYWQWYTPATGGSEPYLTIGEWWLGRASSIGAGYQYGSKVGAEYSNETYTTGMGRKISYPRYHYRKCEGLLRNALDETVRANLLTLYNGTHGGALPFLFVPDPTDVTSVMLGRLSDPQYMHGLLLNGTGTGKRYSDVALNVHEDAYEEGAL
jgi:hypothetical protein